MKKIGLVMIAIAITCGWAGVANASSHGMMPPNLSFWEIVNWQLVHFRLHIDFVYAALQTVPASPTLAWQMLSSQTLCAGTSPWTAFLFGSPGMALTTFSVTLGIPIAFFLLALLRVTTMLTRRARSFLPLLAPA